MPPPHAVIVGRAGLNDDTRSVGFVSITATASSALVCSASCMCDLKTKSHSDPPMDGGENVCTYVMVAISESPVSACLAVWLGVCITVSQKRIRSYIAAVLNFLRW